MLQCQHCTHFTIFFPIINLFLSQPYMIHPLRQVQHTYRDYVGMKAELGRKSESSRDVDLAFQNLLSEATTDTLPNTPNPKWRCQVYLAIRFSAAAVFCSAKLNQSCHFSSACADLKPVATHEHIRHPCPSGCQGWKLGQEPFHWWNSACQNVRHSFTQPELCLAIVSWRAVYWNSAFISHDDTISFVLLKQKRLKFNIDNPASRDNGNSQGP